MKKVGLTLLVALVFAFSANAQLKNKAGEVILPETGDWAIGVDATCFLSYFGNFIGGNGLNVAPTFDFLNTNQSITGKYFVSETMAYRGSLRLGMTSLSGSQMVADRSYSVVPVYPGTIPVEVKNTWKQGATNISLCGGVEWRRGHGRLQGFYGGELGIGISSSSETFTYGNALTQQASTATLTNVDVDGDDGMLGNINLVNDPFGNAGRATKIKNGTQFGIGVRGFIGAEYFVLPKLSIGGEFGLGLALQSYGTKSTTIESEGMTSGTPPVEATSSFTVDSKNPSYFGLDNDNTNSIFGPAGSLKITFHF
jgi:hypothetical protein